MTFTAIKGFFGDFHFLSNFHEEEQVVDGKYYASNEHYYQAMKATNEEDHEYVRTAPTPGEAKKRGRRIDMRPDWESIKQHVMRKGLESKFCQNSSLRILLLSTNDAYLEETNYWGDRYWGVCSGVGKNRLGLELMALREKLYMERFYGD